MFCRAEVWKKQNKSHSLCFILWFRGIAVFKGFRDWGLEGLWSILIQAFTASFSIEVLGVWGDFARGFRGLEAQSFTTFGVSVVFGFAPLATLAVLGLSLRCHYGAG